ncbi:MAG: hypothetical protein V4623_10315 [Pseudomonadota bacterium]
MKNALRRSQEGVALIMTLIVLVALLLASVSLIRSVDTANLIAGNMAFKKGTLSVSDCGIEHAYRWLQTTRQNTPSALDNDGSGVSAFYRSSPPNRSSPPSDDTLAGLPTWPGGFFSVGTGDTQCPSTDGYAVNYMIHRMCLVPNTSFSAPSQSCSFYTAPASQSSGSGSSLSSGAINYGSDLRIYYRITCVVTGPHNARSVIQSLVLITA